MSRGLMDAAPAIGGIMAAVVALVAVLCILANDYFKRRDHPADDESGEP